MAGNKESATLENVPSALLLTEFRATKDALKRLAELETAQRDEIERRLKLGLVVQNDKAEAVLSEADYVTFNVAKAIAAIKKWKLDPAFLLKVVNSSVKALPAEVQAAIPFVTETKTRVNIKALK